MLSVILDVELIGLLAINVDVTSEGVVEPFDQLDTKRAFISSASITATVRYVGYSHSTLARTTSSNEGDVRSRFDFE